MRALALNFVHKCGAAVNLKTSNASEREQAVLITSKLMTAYERNNAEVRTAAARQYKARLDACWTSAIAGNKETFVDACLGLSNEDDADAIAEVVRDVSDSMCGGVV